MTRVMLLPFQSCAGFDMRIATLFSAMEWYGAGEHQDAGHFYSELLEAIFSELKVRVRHHAMFIFCGASK